MPSFLAPHKSGAHRVTAIALYRALLTKCRAAPPPLRASVLRAVVKNSFARNRHVTSRHALQDGFAGGYEALDHLEASIAGNQTSILHLNSLLARLPSTLKTITTTNTPPKPSPTPEAKPAAKQGSALDLRPRPAFSLPSRRRIPVLVSANKIPILRFTKPQPAALSHYIKSRVVNRQKRLDRKAALEAQMEIAKGEDQWDRILYAQGLKDEAGGGKKNNPLWTKAVYDSYGYLVNAIETEGVKNREMAEKMVAIIDKEKELAEIERKERKRLKNEERRKNKV
ncbi:hypothetical protein E4T44_08290 [Aureobasidium sp. EXF-8845]|nr:hypothetical protein E4T44_08290 [Aureobasidium sp. EXF-8845]KAI4843196.1 hypothetical protein E4T45_08723 [Aureobasidium sp. EXF-8846]